jgi:hypothetical protein
MHYWMELVQNLVNGGGVGVFIPWFKPDLEVFSSEAYTGSDK